MTYLGIDIGSTCAKSVIMNKERGILDTFVIPTGWSSLEALKEIKEKLRIKGYNFEDMYCISTGYGRQAVEGAKNALRRLHVMRRGPASSSVKTRSTSSI